MVQAVMREMGSNGEQEMKLHPPLTSCCVAQFLTGCRLVVVRGPGVGDPCSNSSGGLEV